jgi:GntR family transcriptional regulator
LIPRLTQENDLAPLTRQSFDPLYFQIEREILNEINHGHLQTGDRLPSETEIANKFQVSRITARHALEDLVKQGVAYSQQGRGTFVAMPRIREVSGFLSYSEDMVARGLRPSSRVLDFQQVEPDEPIQKRLQIRGGEKAFCLKRVRLANEKPMVVETAYLPATLCPALEQEDFSSASLYTVLREKYGIYPTWADAEIVAAQANQDEAEFLGMKAGMPVLCADRLTYTRTFTVIESVRSVYCGDRFSFFTGRQYIG